LTQRKCVRSFGWTERTTRDHAFLKSAGAPPPVARGSGVRFALLSIIQSIAMRLAAGFLAIPLGEMRTTPPIGHDDFVLTFSKWMDGGAPCPSE
jgi:hypothetical protein